MPRPGPAARPIQRGRAGAAAGAGHGARPPRRSSSSCGLPAPSAARPPSAGTTAGSPAAGNTPPPGPAGPPATPNEPHQLPWQQRLPPLDRVPQTVMIAAAVPSCGHIHLTCTNDPMVTNYCCRIRPPHATWRTSVPPPLLSFAGLLAGTGPRPPASAGRAPPSISPAVPSIRPPPARPAPSATPLSTPKITPRRCRSRAAGCPPKADDLARGTHAELLQKIRLTPGPGDELIQPTGVEPLVRLRQNP